MAISQLSIGLRASLIPRLLLSLLFLCSCCTAGTVHGYIKEHCRCFLGDICWPSELTWQALNSSIHGRLVATVPLATPAMTLLITLLSVRAFKRIGWSHRNSESILS